jgi:DNA-binding response OmpR family regulator
MRQLSVLVLGNSGYQVDTTADRAAAWHGLKTNRYDLLITDLSMPSLSGTEFVEKVRLARPALPVIIVTRGLPPQDVTPYADSASTVALLKPSTMVDLLGTVSEVLLGAGRDSRQTALDANNDTHPSIKGSSA